MLHARATRSPHPATRTAFGGAGTVARVALVLAMLAASACSSTSRTALDSMKMLVRGAEAPAAETVAASPYALLQVDGAGIRGTMWLGYDDDGRLAWHGGRGDVLFTRDGVLAGSRGLRQNVDEIRILGDNPFLRLASLGEAPVTVMRRYDWRDGYRYGVAVEGRLRRRGSERVEILGKERELVHFEEELSGPGVRGSNHYWADPATGAIWKSRQLVAPGIWVELVLLKPYLGTAR